MEKKRNYMRKTTGIAIAALLVIAAFGILPAAADPLPDYHTDYVYTANDIINNDLMQGTGTYFIDFTNITGGLKAIHISNDSVNYPDGQVTDTIVLNDYFYITDTGGRKFQDNIVLLVAVNTSDTSYSIDITSSGYNWTPTGDGNAPPPGSYFYREDAVDVTLSQDDFIYGLQTWKPGPTDAYPIYNAIEKYYDLAFVDLHVGTLQNDSLIDNGSVELEYTISDLDIGSSVVFNAYAWNNKTLNRDSSIKYTQGIRWTNDVTGDETDPNVWRVAVPSSK